MRWVLIVLLVLVLLGVWAAVFFFPEFLWIAVAVTAALVLIVGAFFLVRWLRARAKARALERAAHPRPEDRQEVREIRAQMRRAIAAFRRSGRRASSVPWLACVGASGSGKTTLIERSGLPFAPDDGGMAPKTAQPPAARTFRWWWSPEVLVLDAAGRLTSDQGDRDEWMAVLDGLRELRPERPLDGLLCTISAGDLRTLNDFDLQGAAANLRAQLYEAMSRLEMVLPVYCVVTKTDLVEGFAEFWSDLPPQERLGVWGASFAVGDPRLREPARAIEAELEVLAERIHARVLDRIPVERDPAKRAQMMRFPLELRALGARMPVFFDALLRTDAGQEPFVFRGFYLTSATQAGQGAWGGGGPARAEPQRRGTAQSPAEVKSYFVAEVLRSVAVSDRGLGVWSGAGSRARVRRQLRAGLVALAIALLVLVPAIVSYAHNAELGSEADVVVRRLAAAADTAPGREGDPIEPLLDMVDRLEAESSGFAIPGWFGPRASQALLAPLRALYTHRIHAWLQRRLRPDLDREIEAIGSARVLADSPMSLDERTPLRESYETVKLYATLVEPKGHVDPVWSSQRLAQAWLGCLPEGGSVPMDRLTRHAANYLSALEHDSAPAWQPSRSLQIARDRLERFDIKGLPYRRLLLAARDEPPIRASDIFGGTSLEFLDSRGDVQVAGTYTASGWAKVRDALGSSQPWPLEASIERWVLGDATIPADDKALREQMRSRYFDEYTRHWMAFLDELRVKTPPNVAAARAELAAFKEADGFYGALFKEFKLNAIHEEPTLLAAVASGLASKLPWGKSEADAGIKAPPPTPVEKSFRPLLIFSGDIVPDHGGGDGPAPLEKYRLILSKLKAALDAPADQANPDAQTQFSEAGTGVAALLDGVDEPMRSRLWRLLMPPVKGGVQAAKVEGVGSLSDDWKANVWTPWDGKLSSRFPFRKTSGEQTANFADFAAFFKPNDGQLWGFVHARLLGWVERLGSGDYVSKKGADPLGPEILDCLSVAQEITDAFYREGDEPGLKLSIQADWSGSDVTGVKMTIGAKETPLPRGAWSPPVKWLGEDAKLEWVQGGRPTQELGRHAFSLLDLLQQLGGLRPAAARGVYVAEFPPLTLKLRTEGKVDALRADFFTRLRCPRELEMVK